MKNNLTKTEIHDYKEIDVPITKNNIIEFLDWLVHINIQHYQVTKTTDYTSSKNNSHFFLKESDKKFTSEEMFGIYFSGHSSDELNQKWYTL